MNTQGLAEDFPMTKPRYGLGVAWDTLPGRSVDIDLQCVVVNSAGAMVDCAYYNNMKAARGITHSGDEKRSKSGDFGEIVWVNFNKLSPDIHLLLFVVAAYSGGSLGDVSNGRFAVMEEKETQHVATFPMEQSRGCVDVVGAMFRSPSGWIMRILEVPAEEGQHFMDILPLLATTIRGFLPNAPARQKVAFAIEKGGVLDLPKDLNQIIVGLGWDVDAGQVDLDVSAVLIDAQGKDVEAIFFGKQQSKQHDIVHSGDNLTGDGDGDDEQIRVGLLGVGPSVTQIVFVVNIYSPRWSFQHVANPFCRVVDQSTGMELWYALSDAGNQTGLVIAKLAREAGGRWGFHALGIPCGGRTYKDCKQAISQAAMTDTASLMVHQNSMPAPGGPSMGGFADDPRAPLRPPQHRQPASAPTPCCAPGCSVQ